MLIGAMVLSSTPGTSALTIFSLSAMATLGKRNLSASNRTSFTFLGGGAGGGGGGGEGATAAGNPGGRWLEAQPASAVSINSDTRKILTAEFTVISKG